MIRRVGGIWFWRLGPLGGSFYMRHRAAPQGERMKRKIDWFLVAMVLALVALLSAPVAMYELHIGPYQHLALCDTDTDCGCVDDCLE